MGFWGLFWGDLGSFGSPLRWFWGLCGAMLGPLWGSFGVIGISLRWWVSVGRLWGLCGAVLGSLWGGMWSPWVSVGCIPQVGPRFGAAGGVCGSGQRHQRPQQRHWDRLLQPAGTARCGPTAPHMSPYPQRGPTVSPSPVRVSPSVSVCPQRVPIPIRVSPKCPHPHPCVPNASPSPSM